MAGNDPLVDAFPGLAKSEWKRASSATAKYNCIAFALGYENRSWWPQPPNCWPSELASDASVSVEAFERLFRHFGYQSCTTSDLESGFERIALYTLNGRPTHAARQRSDGLWESKLGQAEDIVHELTGLNGDEYGEPELFFRRRTLGRRANPRLVHLR